jgi:streptogramin lyase
MASDIETFNPAYGQGVTVAPGTSSASSTIGKGSAAIVVTNLSDTVTAYVRVGAGAQTATTADYPVVPGSQVSLSKARDDNTVAYITASGTGSIHIIPGRGM